MIVVGVDRPELPAGRAGEHGGRVPERVRGQGGHAVPRARRRAGGGGRAGLREEVDPAWRRLRSSSPACSVASESTTTPSPSS
jgi:hypothetical protein